MNRAALDVGTNSFLLTIASVEGGKLQEVHLDQLRTVRLGQGVDESRCLHPEAIARALATFREYRQLCLEYGVAPEEVRCVGTSALRDVRDADSFRQRVGEEAGFELQVISGEEEAIYSWKGAFSGLELPLNEPLVLDLGGGSTELIGEGGLQRCSLDLGAVRGSERFLHHDPPLAEEQEALRAALRLLLEPLEWPSPSPLVAVGGTATTLASVAQGLPSHQSEKIHGFALRREEIQRQITRFVALPLPERQQIAGLPPQRAEVIVAGSLILETLLAFLGVDEVFVSERGLRYGLLLDNHPLQD